MEAVILTPMQVHGSCVARDGAGVLLLGRSGSGKSDLALRLIDRGFVLVADDRVDISEGRASAPVLLAGLLEVRGLGLVQMPYLAHAALVLAVRVDATPSRLPLPESEPLTGLPLISLDPFAASAAQRVDIALNLATGRITQHSGAFAP